MTIIYVLILVLVEHTLGAWSAEALNRRNDVLILVLVEHTLGDPSPISTEDCAFCLNPCFSGTYSRRSILSVTKLRRVLVLILVLVEHTLGVNMLYYWGLPVVLILVLVEHTLGE